MDTSMVAPHDTRGARAPAAAGRDGRRRTDAGFLLVTDYEARGDQPAAIAKLVENIEAGKRFQTLMGVTGSGKTFTMANVIARVQKPTLVIAPNKTLAAQLYAEFRELFPTNAVAYFVSYYDYYQPEAYIPATDTYIEKETLTNDEIDRMRHATTAALRTRRDVIVVASVSCIFGLGPPPSYFRMAVIVRPGQEIDRDELLNRLVASHYHRTDADLQRGTFRARGDVVEVLPSSEDDRAVRIELAGDTIERVLEVDPLVGTDLGPLSEVTIFPATHYATAQEQRAVAAVGIEEELGARAAELRSAGRILQADRIVRRTRHDLQMLASFGFCPGIENYSRHLSGRAPGEPAACLLDYFPDDFLVFIDECHQTIPQIAGMYHGDRARKQTLVEHGFRLPSALDNRPLKFDEFERHLRYAVFVSATPDEYELQRSGGNVVEQINRPTGLLDPVIEVHPADRQVDDLLERIRRRAAAGERILVTCLTKVMAEELADYYGDLGVRCSYLHSDVETIERMDIVRALRLGRIDALIGINLLREGLDIPEASLVAILDADKESFLRSRVSLIQTIGRVSRNLHGTAILYANTLTDSIRAAIDETCRRRQIQESFNREHGITPADVHTNVRDPFAHRYDGAVDAGAVTEQRTGELLRAEELDGEILECTTRMRQAAQALQFEDAAKWRDRLMLLQRMHLGLEYPLRERLASSPSPPRHGRRSRTG
jgi:excinuclease ABC subunit B